MQTAEIVVNGGLRLDYAEQGESGGLPVVFLHGWPDSRRSFEAVIESLPGSIHAYAFSQRGFGRSDRPETGYGVGDLAGDVVGFMDAVGVGAAVLVGHSLGSYVAQRVALDHPERVLGLVLVGSFTRLGDKPVAEELRELLPTLEDPLDPGFVREFQESTLAQPVADEYLAMIVEESLLAPAKTWRSTIAAILEEDHSARLGEISCPTLLISGDRDALVPVDDQDRLAEGIPGARLARYEGAGHSPNWEEPDRVAREIAGFVEQSAGRSR